MSTIVHLLWNWKPLLLNETLYSVNLPHSELEKWRSAEFYEAEVHRMQLPFSGKIAGMYSTVEERQEKRVQQLRRLEEISNRHREERLQQDQKRLNTLLMVQVHIMHTCWALQRNGQKWRSCCAFMVPQFYFLFPLCRSCWRTVQWSSFTGDWWSWTWTQPKSYSLTFTSLVWVWSSTEWLEKRYISMSVNMC